MSVTISKNTVWVLTLPIANHQSVSRGLNVASGGIETLLVRMKSKLLVGGPACRTKIGISGIGTGDRALVTTEMLTWTASIGTKKEWYTRELVPSCSLKKVPNTWLVG